MRKCAPSAKVVAAHLKVLAQARHSAHVAGVLWCHEHHRHVAQSGSTLEGGLHEVEHIQEPSTRLAVRIRSCCMMFCHDNALELRAGTSTCRAALQQLDGAGYLQVLVPHYAMRRINRPKAYTQILPALRAVVLAGCRAGRGKTSTWFELLAAPRSIRSSSQTPLPLGAWHLTTTRPRAACRAIRWRAGIGCSIARMQALRQSNLEQASCTLAEC